MTKFSKTLILSATIALSVGIFANANDVSTNTEATNSELAWCAIKDGDFISSGKCGAVLRDYRKWLKLQAKKASISESQSESQQESGGESSSAENSPTSESDNG